MDISPYFTFLFVSIGLIVVPGPNVLVIVSTSVAHGKTRGLQTVAGTSMAMAIQLFIAAVTTSSFTHWLAQGFGILKWLGVAYLFYMGVTNIKRALYPPHSSNSISVSGTVSRGFLVSITNPKTILFFGAFLPQFVSSNGSYVYQISILSLTFFLLAVVLDSCYALLASRVAPLLVKGDPRRFQFGLSGLLFLGASAWMATARRVQ